MCLETEYRSAFAQPVLQRKNNNITYSEYVSLAVRIQPAMRMRHIAICSLPRSTTFPRIISQTARFSKKKQLLNTKCVFWFSVQLLSETFLILRGTERDMIKNYGGLQVKYSLFLSHANEPWAFSTDFGKMIKFQENPFSGSRTVLCGRTGRYDEANSHFPAILRTRLKRKYCKRKQCNLSAINMLIRHTTPCNTRTPFLITS